MTFVVVANFETKFLEKLKLADEVGDDGLPSKGKSGKKRKIAGAGGKKKRAKVVMDLDSDSEEEPDLGSTSDDDTTLGDHD